MAIKDDMEDVQEAVINELITENGITNTLADDQVTETKILNNAVTTNKIANGAVTAAKLGSDVDLTPADGSVTTAKIDDDAVTTAKITDDAVTPAKLDRAYLETTGGTVSGSISVNNGEGITSVGGLKYIADSDDNAPSTGAIHNFFTDNGTTSALAILKSGNVGIGTTPQSFAKLQVKTDTNKHIAMFTNAVGATIGGITDTGGSAALRIAGSPLIMTGGGGAGSEHMRIQADGTIKISNSSAPATPTNGGVLFVQSGILRFKGQNGTVTDLAQP